jgi:hypothetical protein
MRRRLAPATGAVALAGLLVLALAAGGCLKRLVYRDGARTVVRWVPVSLLDPKGPRDYFVRTQSQREGGMAIQILPFFVYPGPFTFGFTGGISDVDLVDESADAIACFELFEEAFFGDLLHTIDLCGRYTMGGYQAFNSENSDQRFYPGTYLLDFLVEYDGAQVSFSTRPAGAPSYDLVTTFAFDWSTRLLPSFGALGLHKKGVYDLLDVSWTTTMPTDTTLEDACGWHVQEAYRLDVTALGRLEGASPDFAGAATDLGLARAELSLARGLATSLPDLKLGKQVVKLVGRADRRLERAQDEVADQDADGAISQLLKSTRDQGLAFQTLYRLDFKGRF